MTLTGHLTTVNFKCYKLSFDEDFCYQNWFVYLIKTNFDYKQFTCLSSGSHKFYQT